MTAQAVDTLADHVFHKLDAGQRGQLTVDEFLGLPAVHPFIGECIMLHVPSVLATEPETF